MENLIREVVELDKLKRIEVKKLEDEKAKLGSFFREERKKLEKEYEAEAKEIYDKRKKEIDTTVHEAQINAKAKYEKDLLEIESTFKKNKKDWVESLYQYCINTDNKE